jgi:hydroxylaminobenzene mutase
MNRGQHLSWHGMLVLLLGLGTGPVSQKLTNPRMGLAAHLEGVMNGTFLLAVGAAWARLRLSPRNESLAFRTALYGAYANWLTTILAAVFGTAALTPLTSGAFRGQPWQEYVVTAGFTSVALAMITASVLLLVGFRPSSLPGRAGDPGKA